MKPSTRAYPASLVAIAAIGVSSLSFAGSVPMQLTEQGRLLDTNGVPVSGGVMFTFSLYAAATGGTALWTEQQTLTLQNGYLSAQLGTVTPIPPGTFSGAVLYLGLAVNTDPEMTPRQTVSSVPYAIVAGNAVGDITPSSVSVADAAVINNQGQWVGPSIVAYQTATQTANLQTLGATFVDVPGASLSLTLTTAGTTELLAHGSINPTGTNPGYCGFRFMIDGVATGDPTWGNVIAGGATSSWVPWTMTTTLPMTAGVHTVAVQQCGYPMTAGGCGSASALYSAAVIRAMSF